MTDIENLPFDNQTQKAIELIETVYKSIDSNGFEENIGSIDLIVSIITRSFPEDTQRRAKLVKIKNDLIFSKTLNRKELRYENCIESYKVLLKNLDREIRILGLPIRNDVKLDNSIKIENHNNLSQQQSISIEFYIGLLKDSFTESQLIELKDIVKEANTKETIKPKILKKIKDFGLDVSSNILASLISNPEIWSKMFS